jgi:hypothetical protein
MSAISARMLATNAAVALGRSVTWPMSEVGPDCVKTAVDDMILLRFGGRIFDDALCRWR